MHLLEEPGLNLADLVGPFGMYARYMMYNQITVSLGFDVVVKTICAKWRPEPEPQRCRQHY